MATEAALRNDARRFEEREARLTAAVRDAIRSDAKATKDAEQARREEQAHHAAALVEGRPLPPDAVLTDRAVALHREIAAANAALDTKRRDEALVGEAMARLRSHEEAVNGAASAACAAVDATLRRGQRLVAGAEDEVRSLSSAAAMPVALREPPASSAGALVQPGQTTAEGLRPMAAALKALLTVAAVDALVLEGESRSRAVTALGDSADAIAHDLQNTDVLLDAQAAIEDVAREVESLRAETAVAQAAADSAAAVVRSYDDAAATTPEAEAIALEEAASAATARREEARRAAGRHRMAAKAAADRAETAAAEMEHQQRLLERAEAEAAQLEAEETDLERRRTAAEASAAQHRLTAERRSAQAQLDAAAARDLAADLERMADDQRAAEADADAARAARIEAEAATVLRRTAKERAEAQAAELEAEAAEMRQRAVASRATRAEHVARAAKAKAAEANERAQLEHVAKDLRYLRSLLPQHHPLRRSA